MTIKIEAARRLSAAEETGEDGLVENEPGAIDLNEDGSGNVELNQKDLSLNKPEPEYKPAEPTEPTKPSEPEKPTKVSEPSKPTKPSKPSEPSKPSTAARIYAGRETGQGAGALFYCDDTGRFLLVKRSEAGDYPGTWCGLGGGIEKGETPEEAVRREAYEEAQFPEDAPCDLRYIGCQESPDFKFHNYLGIVPEEFEPILNEEHTDHQWTSWNEFPKEMHPCMMEAFATNMGQKILEQHTNAFEPSVVEAESRLSLNKKPWDADPKLWDRAGDIYFKEVTHTNSETQGIKKAVKETGVSEDDLKTYIYGPEWKADKWPTT